MTIEERKAEALFIIRELEKDIELLRNNVQLAKNHLDELTNEEQIKEWCEKYDLEEGLEHIVLF